MQKPTNCRARLRTGAVLPLATVAVLAGGSVLPALAKDHSFQVVHSFAGGKKDGAEPFSYLIADQSGNLYGTTEIGGDNLKNCNPYVPGCGTVFKIAPDGAETVLYAFAGPRAKHGAGPVCGLLEDSAGNLYGTAQAGGRFTDGTVFKLAPDGTEKTLHSFTGAQDGSYPLSNLVMDGKGDLFSTTQYGGDTQACSGAGCGVVFELAPDGTETVLYSFTGGSDGAFAYSGLLKIAGNLYGTTQAGGDTKACSGEGCGVVYELTKGKGHTWAERVLYAFKGGNDGSDPVFNLIADGAGSLYGTTVEGGNSGCSGSGCGTVFKIAPDGTETVLYSFTGGNDGAGPDGVIADKQGNLYGTTDVGGAKGFGTVFKLAPDGTETTLHTFAGSDGSHPGGALLEVGPYLYGTTIEGGGIGINDGVVFRVKK
ncbi:MAG: choice-of-anchor tandem repeat GloVer-containing protein [Rhizomicrobium sp.]